MGRKTLPRETRICACGCTETFVCKINSPQRYIFGHQNRGKLRIPRETRTCANPKCDNEFIARINEKKKYCSYKCERMCRKRRVQHVVRECACGCKKTFECFPSSGQKYIRGHGRKIGLRKHTKEAKCKMKKRRKPRETRICACGCKETFEVICTSKKRYIIGHHAKVSNPNYKYIPLPPVLKKVLYKVLNITNEKAFEDLLKDKIIDVLDCFFILGVLHQYPKSQLEKMVGVRRGKAGERIIRVNRVIGSNIPHKDMLNQKGNLVNPLPLDMPARHDGEWKDWFAELLKIKF